MAKRINTTGVSFGLQSLSIYRKSLMGIATVLILICHTPVEITSLSAIIKRITVFCNVGVDIFLFLSGLGVFYSLDKFHNRANKEVGGIARESIKYWYVRRYIRIFIPWILIAVPYYFAELLANNEPIITFFLNVTTLNFWVSHSGAWFVSTIVLLYLIAPIYGNLKQVTWIRFIIVCITIILLCKIFPLIGEPHGLLDNVRFVLFRIPIFFLGYTIAPYVMANQKVNVIIALLAITILFFVTFLLLPHMFLFNIIAIPVMLIFCIILKHLSWLRDLSNFMGEISLESYLLSILLPGAFHMVNLSFGRYNYLFVVGVGLILAVAFNRMGKIVKGKILCEKY